MKGKIVNGIDVKAIGKKRPMVAVRGKRYQCFEYGNGQELRIPLGIQNLNEAYLVTL